MMVEQFATSFASQNLWLIPGIPFISFALVGLFLRRYSDKWSGIIATLSIFATAILSAMVAFDYFKAFPAGSAHPSFVGWSFRWLPYGDHLTVSLGVLVDPLSILMMVVVTLVSALVHLYSIGYMKGEAGYGRYFTVLNLFTFSMLGLVIAPNILQTFVFWELVGASSFFLIGFYFTKDSAVSASKKAFIVTRFADLGFLLGILILAFFGFQFLSGTTGVELSEGLATAQALDFNFLNHSAFVDWMAAQGNLITITLILLFVGAAGKSAMFPLHIWLPDAMEGPTPVSALIHAATMVVAGVYLVARLFPLFAASPGALELIAFVGTFTCLFAAVIACTQDDIKRVLAFSTLSQIGYMMLALGVTSNEHTMGFTASTFHLFTHAFFKALLFLGAGAVIHAVHSNSIWDMGGLRKKMPITHITFLIATLAIAGFPPLAGFFSKDQILLAALDGGHYFVFAVAFIVAGLTSFYMFRIYFVTFGGQELSDGAKKAHDVPMLMAIPLIVLAFLSITAGFVPFDQYLSYKGPGEGHHGALIPIIATAVALLGCAVSFILYGTHDKRSKTAAKSFGAPYKVIKNKFYIDEVYLFVTHKILFRFIAAPIAWFDRHVVDGSMNLTGWMTRTSGAQLRRIQTGQVHTYCTIFVGGFVVLFGFFWLVIR